MLNIAHAGVTEGVNGPGRRFTVWAQGCPRRCDGCFNPELLDLIEKIRIDPLSLAAEVLSLDFDGLTLSGGEPFSQAGEFSVFVKAVKTARPEVTAIAFTGYTREELKETGGDFLKLLSALDLLIDGRFERENTARDGLRGSENQRLIPLTEAGERLLKEILESPPPLVQATVSERGEVIISGFPPAGFVERVREKLG